MANQFTKGLRKHHDESTKDKIRAEVLAKTLFKFAKSKGDKADKLAMSPAQVQAARVLIERGKPALQAVEQTVTNHFDRMTEEELLGHIQALINSNPALIEKLGIGLRPVKGQDDTPAEVKAA